MPHEGLEIDVGRIQLGIGALAGAAAYVAGFLVSFLPGPIANPRIFPPNDVVNATINTTERPRFEDATVPLTETIDSFSSAGGLFYNAHFVDVVVGSRPTVMLRSNVLLASHANASTSFGSVRGEEIEIVLAGGSIPPVLLFAVPILLLAAGGFLVNDRTRERLPTPETAVTSGAAVALGYLPLVAIGASMIRFRNPEIIFGRIDLVPAILVAGVVYPLAFGGLGGYAWHTRERRREGGADGNAAHATDTEASERSATGGGSTRARSRRADEAGESSATTATVRVAMTDGLAFGPDTVTIDPGDTVTWENAGSITFTVTAYEDRIPPGAAYFASGGFDSEADARDAYPEGGVAPGESYAHTFEAPGTYEYFCVPQEGAGMVGTVEVRDE
jgi:plastocyanin